MQKQVDIEKLKKEIIKRLKPLNPQKIILFGSYAYGKPNENSDIDLFLIKDIPQKEVRKVEIEAGIQLFDLIKKYKIGFDIFVDSQERIIKRIKSVKDQFYNEVMQKGIIIYE